LKLLKNENTNCNLAINKNLNKKIHCKGDKKFSNIIRIFKNDNNNLNSRLIKEKLSDKSHDFKENKMKKDLISPIVESILSNNNEKYKNISKENYKNNLLDIVNNSIFYNDYNKEKIFVRKPFSLKEQILYICRIMHFYHVKQSANFSFDDMDYLNFQITFELLKRKNFFKKEDIKI
jgi:hypothetical protein